MLSRKARALAGLNHYDAALKCCNMVLEDDPENIYTIKLKQDCEEKLQKETKRNLEIARSVASLPPAHL